MSSATDGARWFRMRNDDKRLEKYGRESSDITDVRSVRIERDNQLNLETLVDVKDWSDVRTRRFNAKR